MAQDLMKAEGEESLELPEQLEIMHAVQDALDGLDVKASAGNKEWTRAITTTLCNIGRRRGCTVGAAPVNKDDRDWGEWLYDVTWLKSNADDLLVEAPLVAECEWGNLANIDEDFQKLLLARSTVRLMIFDGGYSPGSEKIADHLADQVRAFALTRSDDAWLLAAWERMDSSWMFRWFTVENGASKPFPRSSSQKSPSVYQRFREVWADGIGFEIKEGTVGCSARYRREPLLWVYPKYFQIAPRSHGNSHHDDVRSVRDRHFPEFHKAQIWFDSEHVAGERFQDFVRDVKNMIIAIPDHVGDLVDDLNLPSNS